jgi:hypothetical protein
LTTPSAQSYPENPNYIEEQKTKICTYKTCPFKGEPQPIDNFYKANKGLHKRQGWCKLCMSAHAKLPPTRPRSNGTEKPEFKVCTRKNCQHGGILQPIENFPPCKRVKNGTHPACRDCVNADHRRLHNNNREKQNKKSKRQYEKIYKHSKEYAHKPEIDLDNNCGRKWTKKQWVSATLARCRKRASQKGFPCDIDESDLMPLPEFCAVFAVRLDYNAGPDKRVHAAVDKIIPALGYVKGNVRIISNAANWAKLNGIGDLVVVRRRIKKVSASEEPYLFPDFKRVYEAAD